MNLLKSLTAASTKAAAPRPSSEVNITNDVLKGGRIQVTGNNLVTYGDDTSGLIQMGYKGNSDLYSIVRYIVRKAVKANFYLYEIKDQKAFADYIVLKGEGATVASIKQAQLLKTKALTETSNAAIERLLARPNPQQSWKSFAEDAITYKLLSGERFIQVINGLQDTPVRLFVLPSTLMEVHGGETYLSIGKFVYTPTQKDLLPEEIVYSREFNPAGQTYGNDLRGLSPLRVLALSIQKSNEGKLSGLKQYQNAGPPGLLSLTDEDTPLTTEQADQYEAKLARKGGSANRGRVNITGMKAEWVKMGLSPADMDILQSGLFDLRDLCRGYALDSKVLGDPSSSTYNNMADARKAAVIDAIQPAVEDLAADMNSAIQAFNVNAKQYYIDGDVSHFPELAEDLNAMVDRLLKLPITPNQILEAMQYEKSTQPLMDEVWMENGRTPISHFGENNGDVKNDGSYAD